ncbi:MAG: hypothetical protein M3316_08935, partial [Actinomycetota bacterium]|nr:hypothetical protein [Actinomycetota bacterium]
HVSEAADVGEVEQITREKIAAGANALEFVDHPDAPVGVTSHSDDSIAAVGERDCGKAEKGKRLGMRDLQACATPSNRWPRTRKRVGQRFESARRLSPLD